MFHSMNSNSTVPMPQSVEEPKAEEKLSFQLTEGQAGAITELNNWWKGTEQNIILSGSPGTGKTFLAKYFIKGLKSAVPIFTAPTNEAVRQLELSLDGSAPTRTTYSAFGLALSMHSYKQKIYQRALPEDFNDYNLLIVDEASMAGMMDKKQKDAHALLMDYVLASGMRTIWLGDWAQLPPVESENGISPVFEQGFKTLELTQVKRHAGAILDFAIELRKIITQPIKNLPAIPEGVETINRNSDKMINFTASEFEEIISDNARIICWTNSSTKYSTLPGVAQYNKMVRSRLFGEELAAASDIYPTDRILFASPLMELKDTSLEELAFEKLLEAEFSILCSVNAKAEVLRAEIAMVMGVECWKTELEVEGNFNCIAYIPTNAGKVEKENIEKRLRELAANCSNGKEAETGWRYYHTFRQCFADVKHTYCVTGHRSQGSTIDKVYVDVGNMLQNRDRLVAFKNLYVAATRARNSLSLIRG